MAQVNLHVEVPEETCITVRLNAVEKRIVVPNEHLQGLLDIYRMLHAKALPTASRATEMKVCSEGTLHGTRRKTAACL